MPTEQKIKGKYTERGRRITKNTLRGFIASGIITVASLVGDALNDFNLINLNPYQSNPIVVQYNQVLEKKSKIEKSISYIEKIRRESLPDIYHPKNKDLVERIFVDPEQNARIDSLRNIYETELDKTQAQLANLESQEPIIQNYKDNDKKTEKWFDIVTYLGILGMGSSIYGGSIFDRRNRRKRDEELEKHGYKN